MFKKCLKYDLRAFGKIWLIAAAVVLVVSILGGIGFGSMFTASATMDALEMQEIEMSDLDSALLTVRMMLGIISYMILIYSLVIFTAGTAIMLYVHYYRKFFTDQGYLTFTLPVKRSTIFWAKTTSAYIYNLGAIAVTSIMGVTSLIGIGVGILGALVWCVRLDTGMSLVEILMAIEWGLLTDVFNAVKDWIINDLGMLNVFRILFISLLLGIVYLAADFASIMTGYFCITIGATLFRKLKLLSALVCYYVVNNVLAVPAVYFGTYYFMFAGLLGSIAIPQLFENVHIGMSVIYLILAIMAVMFVTIGLAMAFFSIWRLDKKLNLA